MGYAQHANLIRFVEARNVIEAAAACPDCRKNHCAALLERDAWEWLPRGGCHERTVAQGIPDATAWVDQGEGEE